MHKANSTFIIQNYYQSVNQSPLGGSGESYYLIKTPDGRLAWIYSVEMNEKECRPMGFDEYENLLMINCTIDIMNLIQQKL